MCHPALAVVAAIGGAVMQYQGQMKQAKATEQASKYNAEVQRMAAADALARGTEAAYDKRVQAKKFTSTQAAAGAGAGLDISTGTPLQLMVETKGLGELDALRALNNAQREASGLNAQAEITEWSGERAASALKSSAYGSLLSGASNAYFGYKMASMPAAKTA